ncbi:acyl-CoA thioesterase [Colwellia sp. 75C3]|uniref:acyl-CoA thioesterase n=1 Tax=Colwellia sp. 75C3 TaxID=888425 RepID=UPI000C3251F2|nr:acyl-CoA thioesterase [Colwellia sp. 75C3]PKG82506.1 acyl-CoA thioesterase [Colwellia sp. 75C3]
MTPNEQGNSSSQAVNQAEKIVLGKTAEKALISSYLDIKVPFYDVDSMRIVWHGHYVKYIEDARCVLLDKLGYNYLSMEESGYIWPIVDMRLKYVASAKFANNIRVYAFLVEYESRMKIAYEIYDLATGKVLNKAHTIQVAVDIESEEMQFESPEVFINKVTAQLNNDATKPLSE